MTRAPSQGTVHRQPLRGNLGTGLYFFEPEGGACALVILHLGYSWSGSGVAALVVFSAQALHPQLVLVCPVSLPSLSAVYKQLAVYRSSSAAVDFVEHVFDHVLCASASVYTIFPSRPSPSEGGNSRPSLSQSEFSVIVEAINFNQDLFRMLEVRSYSNTPVSRSV